MSNTPGRSRARRAAGGFTLIEMILVVAMMATLAGLALATMSDTQDHATAELAKHELNEVRRAVLQFKADTGFFPRRGPFNLVGRAGPTNEGADGLVRPGPLPGANDAERTAWFDAAENLFQLFSEPELEPGQPLSALAGWNPDRRRGWRGPYLACSGEGRVGRPDSPPVPAVADPFSHALEVPWFEWDDPSAPSPALRRHRAIRFLEPEGDARLVSAGFDGEFGTSDDLVAYLRR